MFHHLSSKSDSALAKRRGLVTLPDQSVIGVDGGDNGFGKGIGLSGEIRFAALNNVDDVDCDGLVWCQDKF